MGGCQTLLKEEITGWAAGGQRRQQAGVCLSPAPPLLPGLGGFHRIPLRTVMLRPSLPPTPRPRSGPSLSR